MADLVDKNKELARLKKQAEKLVKDILGLDTRMKSPGFRDKAPANVYDEVSLTLADKKRQLENVESRMSFLLL
jgi:valyl-tRNA synthetase